MKVDYEEYKQLHELSVKALVVEQEKADNLFKVSRKHCVENQELKKQLAAERKKVKAAEGAVFAARMLDEQQVVEATKQLRNQLDAAVEALKAAKCLVPAIKILTDNKDSEHVSGLIDAALVKIREGK